MTGPRWVLHVPFTVAPVGSVDSGDLDDQGPAVDLAVDVVRHLEDVDERFDAGSAEISREDDQSNRTRLFCDVLADDGVTRCDLMPGHPADVPHGRELPVYVVGLPPVI